MINQYLRYFELLYIKAFFYLAAIAFFGETVAHALP